MPQQTSVIERILLRLAAWQLHAPWQVLLIGLVLTGTGAWLARGLELRTRFDQLLPDDQPSVLELKRLSERTAGSSSIFVVLEGADRDTLRNVGASLLKPLRAVGPPWVVSAEDGLQTARAFLLPRSGLFASVEDLQKLDKELDAQRKKAIGKALSLGLEDDDEEQKAPTFAELKEKFLGGKSATLEAAKDRYPDGYFQSKDGKTLVVLVRTGITTGELERSRAALAKVKEVVQKTLPDAEARGIKIGYAGDLVTGLYEYGAVLDDLVSVGVTGVALILGVIFIYYRRFRVLVPMAVTMFSGLTLTFGLTRLAIGHLNVITGFLVSIIAGNGINFGVLYVARFLEERRRGADLEAAIRQAHLATWVGTLTAALAAAAAYGSLAVTQFHGFKHFAFIGTTGMLLCWLATYFLAPAVLILQDRRWPIHGTGKSQSRNWFQRWRQQPSAYERPFVFLVSRAPRTIAVLSLVLAAVGAVAFALWLRADPIDYNMRHMQNDLGGGKELYRVAAKAADVLGNNTESGMVVLANSADEVPALKRALEERRDAAPPDLKPFDGVHALQDFVPPDQAAKIPILEDIRRKLLKARHQGGMSDADWKEMKELLPPEDLKPYTLADLPEDLARPFSEVDGTRGRLVFITPTNGKDDNDLHYLLRWADSFRLTRLPNGDVIRGSGRAVIFADILDAVLNDIPKAAAVSLSLTILTVFLAFGRGKASLEVVGSLGVGLLWLMLLLWFGHIKINFFNFVALPITFGIGADYAVNVMQRVLNGGGVIPAMRSTGGAVVLNSLTTSLGYLALLGSVNQAVRSLGLIAVLGEVCCLTSAMMALPSWLMWRERVRQERTARVPSGTPREVPGG
ncbi:MAG TPA: MMPL family transporter [Myxococcaceae bacterium]|nr:MMPL family transporter [Myxococcaceae bacterium]